ncbi:50S ribosomal protein L29 [Candidatus Pacearchaeota archaeon]|nr:50S ribosomal protein L29 [Candidatus Pacearchaeota archaeon]
MPALKTKDLRKMSESEREKKLAELKIELVKSKINTSKTGPKTKEIKKIIAKILTLNKK